MLTTVSVLGKRKASVSGPKSYVLHLASSPEPLTAPSDSEFEPPADKPVLTNSKGQTKRRYKCTYDGCDKAYAKPSRLEEHLRSHTGERPFVCSTCNKSYLRETHLQAHTRTHLPSSEKPFVCSLPDCEKRFWTQQHLRAHIDWHNGAKFFPCTEPDCDEVFTKHHQLRSHLCTVHAPPGTKPYQCSHEGCTKSFNTNQHLRTHMRVHNEKRYTCVHVACIPSAERPIVFYPTWTALQHHIRTAHPPTCEHPSCNGRVFASQKGLRAHQKLHEQRDEEAQLEAAVAAAESDEDEEPPKKKRRGGEYGRDWKCQVEGCSKDFKSSKALSVHHKVTHLGRRDFVCPHEDCGCAFGYKHLLQRHLVRLHQKTSGHSSSDSDDSGSASDTEQAPLKPLTFMDIGTLTGSSYAIRSKELLSSSKGIKCPYPHLDTISFVPVTDEEEGGTKATLAEVAKAILDGPDCDYVFGRGYDLRRHLRAVHNLETDKKSIDTWVSKMRAKKT